MIYNIIFTNDLFFEIIILYVEQYSLTALAHIYTHSSNVHKIWKINPDHPNYPYQNHLP